MNSYLDHEKHYSQDEALNREIEIHKKKTLDSVNKTGTAWDNLYKPGFMHGSWLDNQKNIIDAVDIGSGTGWFTNYLKEKGFENVCGIEPSQTAIDIAKKIYPNNDVQYLCGFAENEFKKLRLERPTLFTTSIVFSHLHDEIVINILKEMDKVAVKGSVFIFNENYGPDFHNNLWHCRTKEWWQKNLPNWEISYDERPRNDLKYYQQGLMGNKN